MLSKADRRRPTPILFHPQDVKHGRAPLDGVGEHMHRRFLMRYQEPIDPDHSVVSAAHIVDPSRRLSR